MKKTNRIIIYPKDIQRSTGKSERYGRYLIQKIKVELNKKEHQHITIKECANYLGIDPDEIYNFLI